MRTKTFSHKDRTFEVRVGLLDGICIVRLFESGKIASPVEFSISHETVMDSQAQGDATDWIGYLMDTMENDVKTERILLNVPHR